MTAPACAAVLPSRRGGGLAPRSPPRGSLRSPLGPPRVGPPYAGHAVGRGGAGLCHPPATRPAHTYRSLPLPPPPAPPSSFPLSREFDASLLLRQQMRGEGEGGEPLNSASMPRRVGGAVAGGWHRPAPPTWRESLPDRSRSSGGHRTRGSAEYRLFPRGRYPPLLTRRVTPLRGSSGAYGPGAATCPFRGGIAACHPWHMTRLLPLSRVPPARPAGVLRTRLHSRGHIDDHL